LDTRLGPLLTALLDLSSTTTYRCNGIPLLIDIVKWTINELGRTKFNHLSYIAWFRVQGKGTGSLLARLGWWWGVRSAFVFMG
jgi:hypothetical protein